MNIEKLFILSFCINLFIIFIVSFGLHLYYRNKPKVDKGFKFAYFGLSYRRKFWRTIQSIPICVISIGVLFYVIGFSALFIFSTLFITLLLIVQTYYNYTKWQQGKQQLN